MSIVSYPNGDISPHTINPMLAPEKWAFWNINSEDKKVKHIVNSNRELPLYGCAFSMANFSKLSSTGTRMCESEKRSGLNEYVNSFFDQSLTWADVKWLKAVTDLPVVVKGVLTGESSVMYNVAK